jgi:hypothetical protein
MSGGGGFLSIWSWVVRGENSATRKAIPSNPSNPNKTSVHIPVGASPPVTGITSGVPSTTTTVGGTTVTAGGATVSWSLTVCGAAGDPKALRNKAIRMTREDKVILSFIVTPFRTYSRAEVLLCFILYNEQCFELLPTLNGDKVFVHSPDMFFNFNTGTIFSINHELGVVAL